MKSLWLNRFITSAIFLLGLLLLVQIGVSASYAKPSFELGVKLGMAMNNATLKTRDLNDLDNYLNSDTNIRMGYTLGLITDLHFVKRKWFGFYTEISPSFITKGYVMPAIEGASSFNEDKRLVTLSYLHLPFIIKFRISPFFYFGPGFYTEILMNNDSGITESILYLSKISLEKDEMVKTVGIGWCLKAGAQVTVAKKMILFGEFGYDFGLTSIRNSDENPTDEQIRLRSLKIDVGLRYIFGKS